MIDMKYCTCQIVGQIEPVDYLDDRLIKIITTEIIIGRARNTVKMPV